MLRPIPRLLQTQTPRFVLFARNTAPRRYIGFARPSEQSRSWKNYATRLGIAVGGIYLYNTNEWFAGEATAYKRLLEHQVEDEILPTVDMVARERRQRQDLALAAAGTSSSAATAADIEATLPTTLQSTAASSPTSSAQVAARPGVEQASVGTPAPGSPEELEEEAAGEGAFNEETGEINWDCPCLGGMAHGPCGPEFREAFSCFVFSKDEPKGINCIENFKTMQDCFRKHPDVYGAELSDDPEDDEEYQAARADGASAEATPLDLTPPSKPQDQVTNASTTATPLPPSTSTSASASASVPSTAASTKAPKTSGQPSVSKSELAEEEKQKTVRAKAAKAQVEADHGISRDTGAVHESEPKPSSESGGASRSESDQLVPRAWHDATDTKPGDT